MPADPALLNPEKVHRLTETFQRRFDLPVELVDLDGMPSSSPGERRERHPLCTLLCSNENACSSCYAEHRRAINVAFDVGDSYSFVCHAGLLVTCTPLANGAQRLGALLSGKTWPEKPSDEMVAEVRERVRRFGINGQLNAAVKGHRNVPGPTLQRAAEALFELAKEMLKLDPRGLSERRERAQQQSQIAESIQAVKRTGFTAAAYPYQREKELIEKVKLGDRLGAKGVLNEILGVVLFRDPMGSYLLKTRLVELLAVLSRAAAEAGVDVEKILERNMVYFREILNSDNDVDLCVTISKALNHFLDTVCAQRDEKVETPVTAVLRYIELNYNMELTVEELARQANLSPSRIAHLFQEKLGTTMIETVTRVRLEQSKRLLLETNLSCTEIAYRVGYNDQSYFTRVFHSREKVTPRKFRIVNRGSAAPDDDEEDEDIE
ncbi:MAG TPA: helix-turn-helix domain-containing protein [Planctomycetota bacterium]|jgi:two-component system response regulator YesN